MSWILFSTFLVLLLLRVPVAFCMIISALAALVYDGDPTYWKTIGRVMCGSMFSLYPFLAVPLFILAGDLMNQGGLSKRITALANSIVGPWPGGLAMVTTVSAQMFGAISGASSATCVAIGKVMIPAMKEQKYPGEFSCAVTACSSTIGALIPPSVVLLIYGSIASVSIEKLFLGGVGPGILMGLGLMCSSYLYSRNTGIRTAAWVGIAGLKNAAWRAVLPLLLVLLIFGGILGGIFTATEASAVAVFYAFVVSVFLFRQIKWKDLPSVVIGAGRTTATLSFLICAAVLFARVLALGQLPQAIADALLDTCAKVVTFLGAGENLNYYLVLLVLNLILLIIGMFVDAGPALLIVVPVLKPVGDALGVDPVHFGVLVVCNLIIGLVTPPVGTTLFVASGVGNLQISRMIPYVLRYFLPIMVVIQLMVTFVPELTLWLPSFLD